MLNAARIIRERLARHNPDIICLTEAYAEFLPTLGHLIEAEADYGYPLISGRRKVLLWSRQPWVQFDQIGHPDLPTGRFIFGRTATPLGEIDVVSVCIPWAAAHVSTGRRDRRRWEDHIGYLAALGQILRGRDSRLLVIGDFNQTVPKTAAPQPVFDALSRAVLSRLRLATGDIIQPEGKQSIDHLAHTGDFETVSIESISSIAPDGRPLSDHFGLRVLLRPSPISHSPVD